MRIRSPFWPLPCVICGLLDVSQLWRKMREPGDTHLGRQMREPGAPDLHGRHPLFPQDDGIEAGDAIKARPHLSKPLFGRETHGDLKIALGREYLVDVLPPCDGCGARLDKTVEERG